MLPASEDYYEFVLFYGFVFGSVAAFALGVTAVVTNFALLLAVQTAIILIVDIVPWLRRLCLKLVPRRTRHHRAAREAMRQYHVLHAQIPASTPFVLLYVSLAECYVHVVTNPVVHKKIPGNWDSVTEHFSAAIRKLGLRAACSEALQHIADILAAKFPSK